MYNCETQFCLIFRKYLFYTIVYHLKTVVIICVCVCEGGVRAHVSICLYMCVRACVWSTVTFH